MVGLPVLIGNDTSYVEALDTSIGGYVANFG